VPRLRGNVAAEAGQAGSAMKLAAVRKFAFSLPEVTEEPHFDMTSFRVRGKIFVTAPPEETHIHVFVDDALRGPALAVHPDFIEPLLWGGKVRGLRIALAGATPGVVENLVRAAWEEKSKKRVLAKSAKSAKKK
jgi:hypothetical protein